MRMLVIGSTSRTGLHLVREGTRRGHAMTAFTRRPDALGSVEGLHRVVEGDGLDLDSVRAAVEGHEVVATIVAPADLGPSTTTSDVIRNVVHAMESTTVRRLVITSSRSLTMTRPWLLGAMVWSVFRHVYVDLVRAETIVRESSLEWTIARATRLTDGRPKGGYHADFEADATGGVHNLDRADYALALLDAMEDETLARRAIGICGAKKSELALARRAA